MNNGTTNEQITNLTRELENLVIEQEALNNRVTETRERVAALHGIAQLELREQRTIVTAERVQERTEAIEGTGYYIGDQVDIHNPSLGQELRGTVIGKTKDNLLRIQTRTGKVLRRLPKNVRLS